MFIFNYHSNSNQGMLKAGMSKEEVRKIIKSNYQYETESRHRSEQDYFTDLGFFAHYDGTGKLKEIGLRDMFMFENINLNTNYSNLRKKLIEKKIEFTFDADTLYLDNKKIWVYIPDKIDNPDNPKNEVALVEAISVDLRLGCSVSFERLISNHIPSKTSYLGSKISSDDGPAMRMNYEHHKYFASHGKSKLAKQYREWQKKMVQDGKIMDAVNKDMDDIKSKTSSTYASAFVELKNYVRTLDPKDFKIKGKN